MTDSKQLDILKRLTKLIEGVEPGNSYGPDQPFTHNLVGSVFRGRVNFGDDVRRPWVSILEDPRPDSGGIWAGENTSSTTRQWTIMIKGEIEADDVHPADPGHALMADVQRRLSLMTLQQNHGAPVDPEHYNLGGKIVGARIMPGVVGIPKEGTSGMVNFFLPVVLSTSFSAHNA